MQTWNKFNPKQRILVALKEHFLDPRKTKQRHRRCRNGRKRKWRSNDWRGSSTRNSFSFEDVSFGCPDADLKIWELPNGKNIPILIPILISFGQMNDMFFTFLFNVWRHTVIQRAMKSRVLLRQRTDTASFDLGKKANYAAPEMYVWKVPRKSRSRGLPSWRGYNNRTRGCCTYEISRRRRCCSRATKETIR